MRVAGYIREAADPNEGDPAFVQHEQIRRWSAENGHHLVAVCQDTRQSGYGLSRDGYLGLLGVLAAGEVDGIVVPNLQALSADAVTQEIMLWDLRARGVAVLSATDEGEDDDPARELVRLVMTRLGDYADAIGKKPAAKLGDQRGITDVIIHLVADPLSREATAS